MGLARGTREVLESGESSPLLLAATRRGAGCDVGVRTRAERRIADESAVEKNGTKLPHSIKMWA
jgi:hypothetical protein